MLIHVFGDCTQYVRSNLPLFVKWNIYIYIVLRSLHSIPCFFLAKAIPIDGYEMWGDEMEEEPRVEPVTTDKNPPKTLEVDWC